LRKAGVAAEAAQAEPVAQVLAAQAREPVVVQAQQAEQVRDQLPEERNKEWALEALARVGRLQTLADRATPQIRPTDLSRDDRIPRPRIHHRPLALIARDHASVASNGKELRWAVKTECSSA
jgi:hypothetical protein